MSYGPGWALHRQQQAAKRARAAEAGRRRRAAARTEPADATVAAAFARIEAGLARIEAMVTTGFRHEAPVSPLVACVAPVGSVIGPFMAPNSPEIPDGSPAPADLDRPARWGLRWRERAADGGWAWADRWWTGEVTRIGQPRTTDDPAMIGTAGLFEDEAEADAERRSRGYGMMRPCPLPDGA